MKETKSPLYLRCYALMLGTVLFTVSVGRYTTIYSDTPNWKDDTVISPHPYILSSCLCAREQSTLMEMDGWKTIFFFSFDFFFFFSHNIYPSLLLSLWKVIGTVSFGKYHLNSTSISFSFSSFNWKIIASVGENSIAKKDRTKAESWLHLMWCWC